MKKLDKSGNPEKRGKSWKTLLLKNTTWKIWKILKKSKILKNAQKSWNTRKILENAKQRAIRIWYILHDSPSFLTWMMATLDGEGVWLSSCLIHIPGCFSGCEKFILQEETNRCGQCNYVPRTHVSSFEGISFLVWDKLKNVLHSGRIRIPFTYSRQKVEKLMPCLRQKVMTLISCSRQKKPLKTIPYMATRPC